MRTLRKLQNADLCSKNGHYLVMVDQFSGWPQVVAFPDENTTTHRLINAFCQFFTNVGAPVKIWTDNGWQFVAAEFQKFPEGLGHNARHVIPSLRTVELVSWNGGEDDEEVKCSGGNFRTPSQPIGERSPLNGRWKQTSSKKKRGERKTSKIDQLSVILVCYLTYQKQTTKSLQSRNNHLLGKTCNVVEIAWFVHLTSASNFPMLIISMPIAVIGYSPFSWVCYRELILVNLFWDNVNFGSHIG